MKNEAKIFAVLGDPVAHSLSPVMHEAAFRQLGLSHRYIALRVPASDIAAALRGAKVLGFSGLNLTVPHKQIAMDSMDLLGNEAKQIGAVNTVSFVSERLRGDNTDGRGFLAAMDELGRDAPAQATILGAGGAATAIVHALLAQFPTIEIDWVSRQPNRVAFVSSQIRMRNYDFLDFLRSDGSAEDSGESLGQLLVNCTSVGLPGKTSLFPVEIDLRRLEPHARVIDIVYPRPRGGLLDKAEAEGFRVQDGLAMLLWQGVFALEIWLNRRIEGPTVEVMRNALSTEVLHRKNT